MQCSEETLARLFYNVSSSFQLLFIFFYFTSIFLAKLFYFLGGNPFLQRNHEDYEYGIFSDEEEEEEHGYSNDECPENDHLVADIIGGGESLMFLNTKSNQSHQDHVEELTNSHEHLSGSFGTEQSSEFNTPPSESEYNTPPSESEYILEEVDEKKEEETTPRDADSANNTDTSGVGPAQNKTHSATATNDRTHNEIFINKEIKNEKAEVNFRRDENFLVFAPGKSETNKLQVDEQDKEETFGDSCTVGSTSKSSSEWRSSINCRDSGTEDPFSSSSRRSCPKWESYTVFQKYDEEMLFLDRISAQKLHETESLRSIQACPRSISDRIIHKLAPKSTSTDFRRNPYHELEAAYVAQICLTWEALNWNYKHFQRQRASRREQDPGCPAYVAQHFQQFQVLLQRYIENEPYEHGRRPEIYARMRSLAPKLLQVPEYRDSDDEKKEEGSCSRIPSDSFLEIIEESIKTFMNFLKADKESHRQIIAAFFRRNRRRSVDPTLLLLLKKVNKKKKVKVKDLRGAWKCLRRRRLKVEEEMEILMALIDLKVVSRVLRMTDLREEQLNWCEGKMSKVRVSDGKLQRDSSPLFFPAH